MGFMAITKDVNVELLNECFELRPFHGLCKPHASDRLVPTPLPDSDPRSRQSVRSEDNQQNDEALMNEENAGEQDPNGNNGNELTKSSKKVSLDGRLVYSAYSSRRTWLGWVQI